MACVHIKLPGGDSAIICGVRQVRRPTCRCCPRESTKLCDFPVKINGRTKSCDIPLCDDHAIAIGPDRDLCPWHEKVWKGKR